MTPAWGSGASTTLPARQGQLCGFRWKDWADYKSSRPSAPVAYDDQPIGVGDGVTADFQLVKTYASGPGSQVRVIRKPVAGTVRIGLQGDEVQEGVHWAVDAATGVVTFASPPAVGERVTAGFEVHTSTQRDSNTAAMVSPGFATPVVM